MEGCRRPRRPKLGSFCAFLPLGLQRTTEIGFVLRISHSGAPPHQPNWVCFACLAPGDRPSCGPGEIGFVCTAFLQPTTAYRLPATAIWLCFARMALPIGFVCTTGPRPGGPERASRCRSVPNPQSAIEELGSFRTDIHHRDTEGTERPSAAAKTSGPQISPIRADFGRKGKEQGRDDGPSWIGDSAWHAGSSLLLPFSNHKS